MSLHSSLSLNAEVSPSRVTSECKKCPSDLRGTLVSRLQSAEASSSLLPSAPAVTPQSPRVRNVSSSPVTKAATPPVRQPVPTAPMRMATPASESLPTSVPGKVATTSGDLDVETPVLAEPAPVTQQVRVSAPGIPIKPNTIPQSFLAINFPDPTPQEEIAQVIVSTDLAKLTRSQLCPTTFRSRLTSRRRHKSLRNQRS